MRKVKILLQHKILKIFALLFLIAILFLFNFYWFSPSTFWLSLLILSILSFTIGIKLNQKDKGKIKVSLICGFFLAFTDLVINYQGKIFWLYSITPTTFTVLADPMELPLIAFFGGVALSLFFPRNIKPIYLVIVVLLISFVGTVAEVFLNRWGIMTYYIVGSLDAFITYLIVFTIFFIINYVLLKKF